MIQEAIAVVAVVALSVAVARGADTPVAPELSPPQRGVHNIDQLADDLAEKAVHSPWQTPGMTDRQWCLESERYWQAAGAPLTHCQGRRMSEWAGPNAPDWGLPETSDQGA